MHRSRAFTRPLLFVFSLAILGAWSALTAVQRPKLSLADPLPAIASASPSVSASASAATSASAAPGAIRPKFPLFRDDLPPTERSEVPKAPEWKTALRIDFDRRLPIAQNCQLLRIREWVRLSCSGPGSMASHISGPSEGWSARTDPPEPGVPWDKTAHFLQFPVRRGERRLMELRAMETGNYGDGLYMTDGRVVSVQWNDGEAPMLAWH